MDCTDGRIIRAPARRKRNDEQLVDRVSTQIHTFIYCLFVFKCIHIEIMPLRL